MCENQTNGTIWQIVPTLGGGGAEKMVLDLADGLMKRGYIVKIISLYDKNHAASNRLEYAKAKGLEIIFLNKHRGFDVNILRELRERIIAEKPAIIHTHIESFQYVAILGMTQRFNHIHTMHSIIGRETKVYKMLLSSTCRRKRTYFVVLSNMIATSMRGTFSISDDRLKCIPNGIDRALYPYVEREDKPTLTFLAVGSLIPVKNQEMIIRSFSRFLLENGKNHKLVILGEGELREQLLTLINALDLNENVSLPGNVENVSEYLNKADVFVMSSHYEGVSLALLEAASSGLPIITTNTGGTPEVVRDDAILVDDDDEIGLSMAMNRMISRQFRIDYSKKSLQIASRFDKNRMVSEYLELYKEVEHRG